MVPGLTLDDKCHEANVFPKAPGWVTGGWERSEESIRSSRPPQLRSLVVFSGISRLPNTRTLLRSISDMSEARSRKTNGGQGFPKRQYVTSGHLQEGLLIAFKASKATESHRTESCESESSTRDPE